LKRRFSKILGVGLTLALLASLLLTAAPVSAITQPTVVPTSATISATTSYAVTFNLGKELADATLGAKNDVDAKAEWSTTQKYIGSYAAHLVSGPKEDDGDEARIVIPMPAGTTLGDIDSIAWWEWLVAGYPPHVDIILDMGGSEPDALVIEYAYNNTSATTQPTYGAVTSDWFQTFNDDTFGLSVIGDTANAWLTTGAAGGTAVTGVIAYSAVTSSTFVYGTLANWKAGNEVNEIDADTPVLRLEIEVDNWMIASEAYVDDVVVVLDSVTTTYAMEDTPRTITITLPVGTVVANPLPAGATLVASPGWIDGVWADAITTGVTFDSNATARTVTATLSGGDQIGEGATVRIKVPGITNPPAIGSYTLTVKTSAETTAVTSAAYAVGAPVVATLPGVVKYYNSAGVLMGSFTGATAIQSAVNLCPTLGNIEVGPGLYTETNILTAVANVVIKATGTAAETIVKGNFVIDHASITIDGLTITPVGINTTIGTGGDKVTIQNCVFTKRLTATTTIGETLLAYGNTTASGTGTITANTFDTSLGVTADNAIMVPQLGLTISNNTFTVDGATTLEDSAINVTNAAGTTTISGNAITGASGIGVTVNGAGTTVVTGNAFSNLNSALNITTGTVTVDGNTIDVCGLVKTTVPVFAGQAAIVVTSTAGLTIKNNDITNSPNEIMQVGLNGSLINMMFNNLTGNTLGIDNNDATAAPNNTLNATHNWWGAATGAATGMNTPLSTTTGLIDATGYLGGEATGTFTNAAVTSLLTKTTVGVDVILNAALGAGDIIGVANYAANPQNATKYPALAGGFYDVYAAFTTAAPTSVLIKFYNANITANTTIYVWGTLAGGWQPVTATAQGVNLFEGFAFATITSTTTPSITGLAGTPFALVTTPLATLAAPTLAAPTLGATDASLSPAFSWSAVTGAKGYEFQLADNPNFILPIVNLTGGEAALIVPFYKYMSDLDYSTTYYWRVKALDVEFVKFVVSNSSAWTTSVFTTEEEPAVVEPEVWMCSEGLTFDTRAALEAHLATAAAHQPEKPPVIKPIVEVVTPAATPITPAWIYVIIAVGAVLVISVVVLIVRTRRVA